MTAARVLALALLSGGCIVFTSPVSVDNVAEAELRNADGDVVGHAILTEVSGGVRVVLEMHDMPPGAKAVHLHAVGRCEPPAFVSAAGHFNPDRRPHGILNPGGPHAGDLPNITIGADGRGRLESFNGRVTVGRSSTSLLDTDGTALIVHERADDFLTDPEGNSGARIACGVVERSEMGRPRPVRRRR